MTNFVCKSAVACALGAFALFGQTDAGGVAASAAAATEHSFTVAQVTEHNAIEQEEDSSQMPTQDPGAATAPAPAESPMAAPAGGSPDAEIQEMHKEFPQTDYPPSDR